MRAVVYVDVATTRILIRSQIPQVLVGVVRADVLSVEVLLETLPRGRPILELSQVVLLEEDRVGVGVEGGVLGVGALVALSLKIVHL